MLTKKVIEQTHIDRETLRFYEKKGLLPPITRTSSGYRNYPEETVKRIEFIKLAQNAGFTLREIKELVELKQSRASCRTGRDIAEKKRLEIKKKMQALKKMEKILKKFISACEVNGEEGLDKKCHLSFDKL